MRARAGYVPLWLAKQPSYSFLLPSKLLSLRFDLAPANRGRVFGIMFSSAQDLASEDLAVGLGVSWPSPRLHLLPV